MKILILALFILSSEQLYATAVSLNLKDVYSSQHYVKGNPATMSSGRQTLLNEIQKNKEEIQSMKYCEVVRNTTIAKRKSGMIWASTSIQCESFYLGVVIDQGIQDNELVRRDMIAEMLKLGFQFEGCIESTQLENVDEKYQTIQLMICSLVNTK